MLHRLHRSIELKTTLDDAWEFFSDPANLKTITPPALNMQIVTPGIKPMYAGMIISYKVHPILSIPMTWVTEITQVQKPYLFVDEQRYGPYRMWHHQHNFKQTERGVIAEDIVDYILPLGPLGDVMHVLLVKRQLESIFGFRNRILSERFGTLS